MPPKRGVKRPAPADAPSNTKAPKMIKKKEELIVTPDLRHVTAPGIILAIGQNDVGQLGLGDEIPEKTLPAVVPGCSDIIAIAAGGMHSVCLTKLGKVLTFGCNDEGALGRDTSEEGSESVPGFVNIDGKVVQITAGDSHSAALLEDGRVVAWGSFRDSQGAMGLTARGIERLPVELLPSIKVAKIASGSDHLVMLTKNGRVYTCGCGEQGQLGRVASRTARRDNRHGIQLLLKPDLVKFKVSKKLDFADIWAGAYCTFAKDHKKGDVYVFGLNNYHQIGLEETVASFHPQVSKTFSGKEWQHISTGMHHTIALDQNGQVSVIGRKEYGRLGLGPGAEDAEQLITLNSFQSQVVDIAAGSAQSFAVTETRNFYAWGMGSNLQLGTGHDEDVEIPVMIDGGELEGKTVVRVSGGGQHTLLLANVHPVGDKTPV